MVDLQYRKPNEVKQDYAPRISQPDWHFHESKIRYLHEHGKTRKEMLHHLAEESGFNPTLAQINAKMRRWNLKVYGRSEPDPIQDGDAMSLCDLPERQPLDAPWADSIPDVSEDGVLEPQLIPFDDMSQCILDHESSDEHRDESLEAKEISLITREIAMDMVLVPHQSTSMFGRSSISHATTSTFATHPSDTSSFRDFRSTAARIYTASRYLRSTKDNDTHRDFIANVLNSWVFTWWTTLACYLRRTRGS